MALLKLGGVTSKVGHLLPQFNLPAIRTCPGSTGACRSFCYATKGFYNRGMVVAVYADALRASLRDDFVVRMSRELRRLRPGTAVRLHASGDFYSADYVWKWVELCRAHPRLRFWAYTRSWQLPEMVVSLWELSEVENIQLFASVDEDTGQAPEWLRHAVIVESFDALPAQMTACPYQRNQQITCAKCTYCFKPEGGRKRDVAFLQH